jgi:hypothetical protein
MHEEEGTSGALGRTQRRTQNDVLRHPKIIDKTGRTGFWTNRTQISPLFLSVVIRKRGVREEGERWRKR